MKTSSEDLILDLTERTRYHISQVELFRQYPVEDLKWKSNPGSWSVLECIEHLNMYGDYYLPVMEREIVRNSYPAKADYKPGLLGNYFANMMLPGERSRKVKTLKDKDPIGSNLDKKTLDRFLVQQEKTLELLNNARIHNLNKIKIPISIATWIKLNLGDTFRVVIYHNLRHIEQARGVLEKKFSGTKREDVFREAAE